MPSFAPLGLAAELRVSGPGLAAGYLAAGTFGTFGTPGGTFPAAPRAAGKQYATGDAMRWTEQGLEFLGRLDAQARWA